MHRYFSLLLLVAFCSAGALLTNGDFEQDIGVGWQQSSGGASVIINRGTTYDPDPDHEIFLEKGTGSGYAKVLQQVSIPTVDLAFSIDAKFYSYDNNEDTLCWAGAAVMVAYFDETDTFLGCTRICSHTEPCPWENSSTEHVIEIQDTVWHDFSFDIADEFDYLPGITPSEVAKIAVVLFDTTDHTCWGAVETARVLADNAALNYEGTNPYVLCLANTVYDVGGNNNGRIDPGETADITATIKNIGGVDFTNLNTTLECTSPYITVTDNSGYFGFIAVDSIKENTADPYEVSANASAPQGHEADFRLIATEGAFADTFEFSLVIGSYHYMVWNPDPTPAPGMAVDSLLAELGFTGNYSTSLTTENLDMYCAIFVCVGIYSSNYVINAGSPEATALENYLNAGGNMYLEGGDVWYYDPLGSGYNFCPLFGIQAQSDGTSDGGPFAGEIGTFTQDMYFQYAGENSFIDHINPTGTGFLVFHDTDNSYNCGVANAADTYKTVGLSFELGGLVDAGAGNSRHDLLDSIMNFFEITTDVEEITKLDVLAPRLSLAPNPFTHTTDIRCQITDNSEFKLAVFDITGRLVKNLTRQSSVIGDQLSVMWNGTDVRGRRLPAGVYFVQLDTEKQSETQKVILVE